MHFSASAKSGNLARSLPGIRKIEIAEYVSAAGQVTVSDLVERFGVSADTIRRDLDFLDKAGTLVRTHGGAMGSSATPRIDTPIDVRLRLQAVAKESVGALTATLVKNDSVLMINAGTTALAVIRNLKGHKGITLATNNLRAAGVAPIGAIRSLYVFGGGVNMTAQATIGPVAFPSASGGQELEIQCDLAVIVVGGVSLTAGFTTNNLNEAAMMHEMLSRATRVAIIADSSKIGAKLFAQVAELSRADYFVTDVQPPSELVDELSRQKVTLVIPDNQAARLAKTHSD
jgi:DeoR/GlpR family transcriptional regulator of sugar metabolism